MGTADAQLDDLLRRADTTLRVALFDHGPTVSGLVSPRKSSLDIEGARQLRRRAN
jgi:hypothetical protein